MLFFPIVDVDYLFGFWTIGLVAQYLIMLAYCLKNYCQEMNVITQVKIKGAQAVGLPESNQGQPKEDI